MSDFNNVVFMKALGLLIELADLMCVIYCFVVNLAAGEKVDSSQHPGACMQILDLFTDE